MNMNVVSLENNDTYIATTTIISNETIINNTASYNGSYCLTSGNDNQIGFVSSTVVSIMQITLAVIMFGIGCATDVRIVWKYLKLPKIFGGALFLQLVVLPFLGFALSQLLKMTEPEALGMLLQAICPGGGLSNVITFWLDGDIDLSLVMTGLSVIISIGTIPLWLLIYPKAMGIENPCLAIPFSSLGAALASIIVPVLIGLAVRYKISTKAGIITKVISVICPLIILVCSSITLTSIKIVVTWRHLVAGFLLLSMAFGLAYCVTRIPWLRYRVPARRTIAVEVMIQNTPVGGSIIYSSFDMRSPLFGSIFVFFPTYFFMQAILSLTGVVFYLVCKKRGVRWLLPSTGDEEASLPSAQKEPLNLEQEEEDKSSV